jgi:hypothetical protein
VYSKQRQSAPLSSPSGTSSRVTTDINYTIKMWHFSVGHW